MDRDYESEMKEFTDMQDKIKDIDWFKAETESARNGQETAMEQAKLYKSGYLKLLAERDSLQADIEMLVHWYYKTVIFVLVAFLIGMMIGGWLF